MKKRDGFTLIELLVAIVIVGIISVVSIPVINRIKLARVNKQYQTYYEGLVSSAKLYVDAYEDDMFVDDNVRDCKIIYYSELASKKLIKNIQVEGVTCSGSSEEGTVVKVIKENGKYSYYPRLYCTDAETGETVILPENGESFTNCENENIISAQYRLVFNSNGGKVCNNSIVFADKGESWIKNGDGEVWCSTTRAGYKFNEWNTKSTGNGSVVDANTIATGNTVVYAKWDPNKIKIKLNANNGSMGNPHGSGYTVESDGTIKYKGNDTIHSLDYGTNIGSDGIKDYNNSSAINLVRTGYRVESKKEWNSKKNGTGTNYNQKENYSSSKFCDAGEGNCEKTLYVNWKPIDYTITFDKKGGNGNTPDINAKYDVSYDLPNNLSKTGYTFGGWKRDNGNCNPSSDSNCGNSVKNLTTTHNSTVKLDAKWKANTYTVSFSGNGSTGGSMNNQSCTYDSDCKLTKNGFSKYGYTFATWNTKANGSGTSYGDEAIVKNLTSDNGGSVTLYAQWKANTYTITLNRNGGSGGPDKIYEKYGVGWYSNSAATTRITNITVPKKSNCSFQGYKYGNTPIIDRNGKIVASLTAFSANAAIIADWDCNGSGSNPGGGNSGGGSGGNSYSVCLDIANTENLGKVYYMNIFIRKIDNVNAYALYKCGEEGRTEYLDNSCAPNQYDLNGHLLGDNYANHTLIGCIPVAPAYVCLRNNGNNPYSGSGRYACAASVSSRPDYCYDYNTFGTTGGYKVCTRLCGGNCPGQAG